MIFSRYHNKCGGLILNGRLYRGATKVAGEIGQTSIDYQGKDFVYGNKGALEAYVGHVHISERAKEIYARSGKANSEPIWRTIKSRCERTFWEKLEIVPARLGNAAGIIGAAALALESQFAAPRSATSESKRKKPR